MENLILVGFGGHAKSIADCIEREKKFKIIGYTDLNKQNSIYEYLGTDDILDYYFNQGIKYAVVCIGYMGKGTLREILYTKLKRIGYILPIIKDPSAIISTSAVIEEGTFIGKNVIINSEAHIGKMCIINTKSLIEHECIISDFSHISVNANLCGQVEVGYAAFIGASATIIQCIKVSSRKIIPAGVTIRKHI